MPTTQQDVAAIQAALPRVMADRLPDMVSGGEDWGGHVGGWVALCWLGTWLA